MLLKNLVKALGKEFGIAEVTKEAVDQHKVERVRLLAKDLEFGFGQKIARIKAARILFGWGLRTAEEWVEANFRIDGHGNPI